MISLNATWRLTSRLLAAGLLLLVVEAWQAQAQPTLTQLQRDFDNGLFEKVIESIKKQAPGVREEGRRKDEALIEARSMIALARFDEARKLLDQALSIAEKAKDPSGNVTVQIYLVYSALERARREFRTSAEFAKKARASASANDRFISSEYHFSIGRTFYSMGLDLSATIWFERALRSLEADRNLELALDIYRYMGLASSARFDYATAVDSYEKVIKLSERSRFKHKHRQALYELANILNATGQKRRGIQLSRKALQLSIAARNLHFAKVILSSMMLNSLYEGDIESAERYLKQLEHGDSKSTFAYELVHGRAVIAALKGENVAADQYFKELAKLKGHSRFVEPYWKSMIAEKREDWQQLIQQNTRLLKLAEESNFRDDLPNCYLGLGKAYLGLGEVNKAVEFVNRAISMIEEARSPGNPTFSFGLLEVYHTAYRLLAELRSENPATSFEIADFLKGRVLTDRIADSPLRTRQSLSTETRSKLEVATAQFIEAAESEKEIEASEKAAVGNAAPRPQPTAVTEDLNKVEDLANTAIISYLFTVDGNLLAYVWTKSNPIRVVRLKITEKESDTLARSTSEKIRNLAFFKKDGRELYDRFLAPLAIHQSHLVIVPDRSIWRIPFQALSPDGTSYLIESKTISYSPSVALLLNSLKKSKPERKSILAIANSIYNHRVLRHVDMEARTVAGMFGSQPILNATIDDFLRKSDEVDILHLSMHAEVVENQPLESFLGFRSVSRHSGRLTVEDLLKVRVKSQSLAFLASCDTNNVINGEGLVSIAWALLGSGSSSVISSHWEVNDKSTLTFATNFYRFYKAGGSTAESVQKASIEMIREKSSDFHEPYYWAVFTLNGDFR